MDIRFLNLKPGQQWLLLLSTKPLQPETFLSWTLDKFKDTLQFENNDDDDNDDDDDDFLKGFKS